MKYSIALGEKGKHALTEGVINEIENTLDVKIEKKDGEVEIEGEGIGMIKAINVIKAIAHGFAPEQAFELFEDDKTLQIIEIPGDEEERKRIRARIIGRNGTVKRNIERYTKCFISVGEKSVGIIGALDKMEIARQAICMLIKGKKHSTMYKFLEAMRRRGIIE